MTEVARPSEVPLLPSDDGATVSREPSLSNIHPPVASLSRENSTKEKVTFEDDCEKHDDGEEVLQGHRRTPSGDKLAKFKTSFRKSDAPPISKELQERARSAPLVKKFALPASEVLVNDYSAALLKHILIHGRMYLSQNYICFESKIFGIKTMEVIPFKDVTLMAKRSKKLKFAHGIEITTSSQTYYFASFVSREKALEMLTKLWREHVPRGEGHDDFEDTDDEDDTTGTATQDYESDDSTLKKKDKKTAKEHAELKLGRSIECQPDHSEEREKGLRRFSSPLLSRVLPNSTSSPNSSKHQNGTASLSASTTNLEMHEDSTSPLSPSNASPPIANPNIPSVSAPTTPIPSPHESEDEEEGLYDEGDGFLGTEAQFQQVLSVSFPVNVKMFFKIFFSDESTFSKSYHDARGDKDLVVKKWSNSPQFGLIRDVLFLSPVKVPLGPSHTRITETQRYHLTKNRLQIDTISMMLDIPYGDSFRVEGKWDVTLVTPESCKLVVNIGVHFMKKTWFKGKIETQTIKETKESFQQWASLAPAEITRYKAANPNPQTSSTTSLPTTPTAQSRPSSPAITSLPAPAQTPVRPVSAPPSTLTSTTTSAPVITQGIPNSPITFSSTIPQVEAARRRSVDGGKFAMVNNLFVNPVPGFSPIYIVLVLFFGLIFIHMYLRIAHLEGRVETLESILRPLLTKALDNNNNNNNQL